MALSNEERERIREEEWVRLQTHEDYFRANPQSNLAPGWGRPYRRAWNPWFPAVMAAIVFAFVILSRIADRIPWRDIIR